jgi:BlaI family penicillinase repressor
MKEAKKIQPTDGELAILEVLWTLGGGSVRDVLTELEKVKPTGYTTVLKLMQIMTDKGLLRRDESERSHVYYPLLTRDQAQGAFLDDLINKAFGGSTANLVMQALSSQKASSEELKQIRRMLRDAEKGNK